MQREHRQEGRKIPSCFTVGDLSNMLNDIPAFWRRVPSKSPPSPAPTIITVGFFSAFIQMRLVIVVDVLLLIRGGAMNRVERLDERRKEDWVKVDRVE